MTNDRPGIRRDPRTRPTDWVRPALYRFRAVPTGGASDDPLWRETRMARLEAALMAAEEPLSVRRLTVIAGLADGDETRRLIDRLRGMYDLGGSAFLIEEIAGGFQLLSRAEYHPWLVRLRRGQAETQLSSAAMETLAVIAYRQPITRADIEAVRGVGCGELLNHLLEKGLTRIAGRDQSLGRPVLYGTTRRFLQEFGLNSLKELPEVEQLRPPS